MSNRYVCETKSLCISGCSEVEKEDSCIATEDEMLYCEDMCPLGYNNNSRQIDRLTELAIRTIRNLRRDFDCKLDISRVTASTTPPMYTIAELIVRLYISNVSNIWLSTGEGGSHKLIVRDDGYYFGEQSQMNLRSVAKLIKESIKNGGTLVITQSNGLCYSVCKSVVVG